MPIMTEPKASAFHDIPLSDYPVKIEFLNEAGEVVYQALIEGPGVLEVPALKGKHGPISVRTTWGDGRVDFAPPTASD